jgi:riboflavin kinase/FMN adenylyltransferase
MARVGTGDAAVVRPAAVSIGVRPTFVTGRGELIEAFLLDFDCDVYGEQLELAFRKRLRGEKRFDSVDALVEQMAHDVQAARAICA